MALPYASGNRRSRKLNAITDIDLNPDGAVLNSADGVVSHVRYDSDPGRAYRAWYKELVPETPTADAYRSVVLDGARYRAFVYRHQHGVSVSLRALSSSIRTLDELGFDVPSILSLTAGSGLVVFAGPTSAGKSTTMAACIAALADDGLLGKAITIEDPIEVDFDHPRIHQREVGVHVPDFAAGLTSALRQTPRIIVIGELRQPEAAQIAVQAALTGHRVLTTVHAGSVGGAIDRLWSLLDDQHDEMLPGALAGVVAQHMVRFPGGTVPVWETLEIDAPCRALLAQGSDSIPQLGFHQHRQGRGRLVDCARRLVTQGVPRESLSSWL